MLVWILFESVSCVDPESFARGGPTPTTFLFIFFLFLVENRGSLYYYKPADNGPTLNASLVAL